MYISGTLYMQKGINWLWPVAKIKTSLCMHPHLDLTYRAELILQVFRSWPIPIGPAAVKDIPFSILHKSIAGRYRPVRVADGPITARCRFM